MLEILHQDTHLVVINKPPGLLVHRSRIAADASEFALQLLRDQLGQPVYPAHRLDRKTSGVLLFALDPDSLRTLQGQFAAQQVEKRYLAIVRGYTEPEGEIDYPLKRADGKLQEALTCYRTIAQAELPVPFGKHASSRYSLVEVRPKTGRMHQIRKHFAHIFHPIIGDRPHGCNKQNRLFLEKWHLQEMMLHASDLTFSHPSSRKQQSIHASLPQEFRRMTELMQFSPCD